MSLTKRQHYIPKFFLDRFSEGGIVWCVDKKDKRKFKASTKDVCLSKDYYETDSLNQNQIEKGLSRIEGSAAQILRKVDQATSPITLSYEEQLDLSIFLGGLTCRTPFFESAMVHGASSQDELDLIQRKMKELQISAMLSEDAALQLYRMKKYVLENSTDQEYLLSDCPILRFRLEQSPKSEAVVSTGSVSNVPSIFEPDIILILPIGPRKILVMTNRHDVHIESTEELVSRINYEVNRVSERFMISHVEPTIADFSEQSGQE